jgi:hypothetical protein
MITPSGFAGVMERDRLQIVLARAPGSCHGLCPGRLLRLASNVLASACASAATPAMTARAFSARPVAWATAPSVTQALGA